MASVSGYFLESGTIEHHESGPWLVSDPGDFNRVWAIGRARTSTPFGIDHRPLVCLAAWEGCVSSDGPFDQNGDPSRAFVSFLLITLGLAFILEEVTASILTHPLIGLSSGFETWHWKRLTLSPLGLILFLVLSAVILCLAYFLFRTDMGRSLRAGPQDLEGALIIGIPVQMTKAWAWSFSLGAAGLAGVFWILLFPVTPFMGLKLTVMSILMVMAVGPGQITRAIGAGFFWGVMESTGSAVIGPQRGF